MQKVRSDQVEFFERDALLAFEDEMVVCRAVTK